LKILDFGVVSRQGPESRAPITGAGMVLGTPAFLAPELIAGHGPFDGRADIYGLGCVAFWLLTGRPPFDAPDAISLLMQHSESTPIPPSKVAEEFIPADVDAFVLECLAKEPGRRPATADLFAQRLDKLSVARQWDQQRARGWWELHAPELVGTRVTAT